MIVTWSQEKTWSSLRPWVVTTPWNWCTLARPSQEGVGEWSTWGGEEEEVLAEEVVDDVRDGTTWGGGRRGGKVYDNCFPDLRTVCKIMKRGKVGERG